MGLAPGGATVSGTALAGSSFDDRRAAEDAPGASIVIGVDPAGPGRDRTVCVACAGSAIVEIASFTDSDARGPVVQFIRKHADRLKLVRVDSAGIGFYFAEHMRSAGYKTVGINVGAASSVAERFRNLKAERYWFLRERFQRGEVSGLTDELLSELAAFNHLINPKGLVEIEDKSSVKSIIGRSPDLAEALMIAIGEHQPQPFEYRPVPPRFIPCDFSARPSTPL